MTKKICPICGTTTDTKDMTRHITGKAKMELWRKEFGLIKKTPHLDYLHKNATIEQSLSSKIIIKL